VYQDFAFVYDRLTDDINYNTWASYIEEIFERNHARPEIVLDLGCGTGSLSIELSKMGFDMIGLDSSEEMLGIAAEKAAMADRNILFINQDMRLVRHGWCGGQHTGQFELFEQYQLPEKSLCQGK